MKRKPLPIQLWLLVSGLLLLIAACAPEEAAPPPPNDAAADAAESTIVEEAETSSSTDVVDTETEAADSTSSTAGIIDPSKYDEFEIITLLPPDAIPAIDNPQFLTALEAADEYEPDELVLGVFINGEARAYSVPHLSSHEIVNDTVGGRKISVTW